MNKKQTGILLINLGTPDLCTPRAVYAYLKQFLNDPRVIDLPGLLRWVLVNALIIPLRYKKSTQAYRQVWTSKGSPLLVYGQALVEALKQRLPEDFSIELGMRYGNPSIESALTKLRHCQKIIALPLFPQYSSAATGSAIEDLLTHLSSSWNIPDLSVISSFYDNPGFIQAYAQIIREALADKKIDRLIFSYHGLPERHLNKSGCQASCSRVEPCPALGPLNAYCYRAQCYESSALIAAALGMQASDYSVSFQSRLGRTPWIKPYTDELLPELRRQKIKSIALVCPSFVADCLETLEEMNMQAREQWQQIGGEEFIMIPCLNDHPFWVNALAQLLKEHR